MIRTFKTTMKTNKNMTKTSQSYQEVNKIPLDIKKNSKITFSKIKTTDFTHGIYTYPAKFVPQIAQWAINYTKSKSHDILLDPFCGSGTTLLESKISGINSYGIDKNPIARLVSKVKTTTLFLNESTLLTDTVDQLLHKIKNQKNLVKLENQNDVNLHYNWKFWFQEETMRELIHIKRIIRDFNFSSSKKINDDLVDFFLVSLASSVKKVSYLDERQIKVKKDLEKVKNGTPTPYETFSSISKKNVEMILKLNKKITESSNSTVKIIGDDARDIKLKNNSVDVIITSPPYLNAIDYPFAHKHELFILDLITPNDYRPHSREYIGVSERVLLTKMFNELHLTNISYVDKYIKNIFSKNPVDANRAFIIYQYFTNMMKVMSEIHRVLKNNKYFVLVVGSNTIRNRYVPTHELLKKIAEEEIGFTTKTFFYHRMKKKKLGIPRNTTANIIPDDMIMVLQKNGD